jgi:DNA polymerase-1
VRKLLKQNSFLDKFDTIEGRIYGKFLPFARSGRLISKDQNLQQLPRKLKKAFQAAPGRALWYADYAQIELRSICAITTCRAMEKLFREGVDVHGYTAEMLFGKDWTDAQRQLTKTYNFNYLYGGGVDVMRGILIQTADMLLPRDQAIRDRRRWQNLWREIFAWQEQGISRWKKGRTGTTPLGRKYKAKMMTDYLNIENQGCAADVFKLALHYLMPKLKEFDNVFICNVIHDSFIIEGPNDPSYYEPVSIVIAEAMQTAWFEVSKSLKIKDLPMPVDVKVGLNWGLIEDKKTPNLYDYKLEGMALCNNSN